MEQQLVMDTSVPADMKQKHKPRQRHHASKQSLRLLLYIAFISLDIAALAGGFFIGEHITGTSWSAPSGINLAFLAVPTYLFLAISYHAYGLTALLSLERSLHRSMSALLITTAFILFAGFFMYTQPMAARGSVAIGIAASAALLLIARLSFHRLIARKFSGQLMDELVITDGIPYSISHGHRIIDAKAAGIQPDLQNPAMINQLATILRGVDRVIIACPPERQQAWSLLLKGSNIRGELLIQHQNMIGAIGLSHLDGSETFLVSRGPLTLRSRAQKRALDLAFTVPLLILLSPLMIIVAIAIKLESPGPIFFRQSRIGRSNSVFSILKFRSMRTELCDAAGNRSASRTDDRITRVGALIRSTSIDELPQLINVLRGDMSLVGPRPHALGSLAGDKLFWEVDEQYWVRHALKPGITGLAQVRGYRGATLRHEDLENRLRSDLEYVNDWSLWLDIVILFATAKVIKHQNAY